MGISPYKKEVAPGKFETFYEVVVEAINRSTGKRVQKRRRGIPSKPKAERLYRELWNECREEKPCVVIFKNWGELVMHYLKYLEGNVRTDQNPNGFSPQLVKSKKSRLSHSNGWASMSLPEITPQFVIGQLDEMERNGSSRSVTNHTLKEVKCTFTHALFCGALPSNPFAGIKMRRMQKKRKEGLSHNEVAVLLAEAKKRNHPYYHIWLLTIALGFRRSELAGLKWIDIDLEQGLIFLKRQKLPGEGVVEFLKDREERIVAIPRYIIPILKEIKLRSRSEFVIEVNCQKWRSGHQANVLREFCREIGMKEITHHRLRATHITLAIRDGIDLATVKDNVGHAKLSTTDQYYFSSGVGMVGSMDGLKIQVPQEELGEVVPLRRSND
jgi:integrase